MATSSEGHEDYEKMSDSAPQLFTGDLELCEHMKTYLFTEDDILEIEEHAEA